MLNLTANENDCLSHRLEEDTAIADCLPQYHADDVRTVCELLVAGNLDGANDHNPGIVREVLRDAVLGSTWIGCAESEGDDRKIRNARRALSGCAKKVAAYLGDDVERWILPCG